MYIFTCLFLFFNRSCFCYYITLAYIFYIIDVFLNFIASGCFFAWFWWILINVRYLLWLWMTFLWTLFLCPCPLPCEFISLNYLLCTLHTSVRWFIFYPVHECKMQRLHHVYNLCVLLFKDKQTVCSFFWMYPSGDKGSELWQGDSSNKSSRCFLSWIVMLV